MKRRLTRWAHVCLTLTSGVQLAAPELVFAAVLEAYPTRPIRMLVPHPAGGGNDILARMLGQRLHAEWGFPVIIDNRAGGNTIIAFACILNATLPI